MPPKRFWRTVCDLKCLLRTIIPPCQGIGPARGLQAPRAKIFRRDEGDAASLGGMQGLMRSNNWQRDSVRFCSGHSIRVDPAHTLARILVLMRFLR